MLLHRLPRKKQGEIQETVHIYNAQIGRRTIFHEVIEEAKLRQMVTGRNPFELV